MVVFDIIVNYSFIFQMMIIANSIFVKFSDLPNIFVLIDFNWLCNLAFSCVASLRFNFIEISLPHTLSNALDVEELNRLGFTDGSGGVCFVYYFSGLQLI